MTDPFRRDEESRQRDRDNAKIAKQAREQFREDFRAMLDMPQAQRVLQSFILAMGLDESPFNGNGSTMGHNVGRQDAARWWLAEIRDHCPEKETVMRIEHAKVRKRFELQVPEDDAG